MRQVISIQKVIRHCAVAYVDTVDESKVPERDWQSTFMLSRKERL